MPDEIYEVIALAARYWFLLLMAIIAWRSYRWYAKDRKKFKRRLRLLPDAGYIGELVVTQGDEYLKRGTCLPVNREGVLGFLRSNDVCVPAGGIANRHLWYSFDDADGLLVEPLRGRMVVADGKELIGRRMRAFLSHGSTLQVGETKMRLRMFAGFEYAGELHADRISLDEEAETGLPEELENAPHSDPVRRMHEIAAWQTMLEDEEAAEPEFYPPVLDDSDGDDEIPTAEPYGPDAYEFQDGSQVFYSPAADDEDEDLKAMYVDEDEAETMKRVVWDKLFKGGKKP